MTHTANHPSFRFARIAASNACEYRGAAFAAYRAKTSTGATDAVRKARSYRETCVNACRAVALSDPELADFVRAEMKRRRSVRKGL